MTLATDRTPRQHGVDSDRTAQATAELPAAEEDSASLSATQVMASMAAAVTAAMVGSKLGVAGTVIGAGLASVISVVGGAVIGHSILLTRKQVKRAVLQVRGADHERAGEQPVPSHGPRRRPDGGHPGGHPHRSRAPMPRPERARTAPPTADPATGWAPAC